MDPFGLLTEQLSALTLTLEDPGTDLKAMLDVLSDDLTAAVPSYLGLMLTLQFDDGPVTLSTVAADQADAAGATIQFPLTTTPSADAAGTLVCYARSPGSFVALAAEPGLVLRWGEQIILDGSAPSAAANLPAGLSGLDRLTMINRAIGVLISSGHSPAQAHAELQRRATTGGQTVPEVAEQLVSGTIAR